MAIKIVTGKPGAGKTYWAVHHLYVNYCNKGSKTLKDETTLITNIDSLQLPHIPLEQCLRDSNRKTDTFFTVPYQEKISKKYPKIVYFIDEAQQYFDRKFYNRDTFYYFETHRHLGHDIYLITQDVKLLPYNLNALSEREIRAQPRSVSILGEFKYIIFVSGESVDRTALPKKQHIFDLYVSMDQKETEKIRNPFVKYLGILLIFMVIAAYGFYHVFIKKIVKAQNPETQTIIEETTTQSPVNIPISTPKIKKKYNNNNQIKVFLDFLVVDNTIYYYDHELASMMPLANCPYKYDVIKSGSSIRIIATVTPDQKQIISNLKKAKGVPPLSLDTPDYTTNLGTYTQPTQ